MDYRRKKKALSQYRKRNQRQVLLASGVTMLALSAGLYSSQLVHADEAAATSEVQQQVQATTDQSNVSVQADSTQTTDNTTEVSTADANNATDVTASTATSTATEITDNTATTEASTGEQALTDTSETKVATTEDGTQASQVAETQTTTENQATAAQSDSNNEESQINISDTTTATASAAVQATDTTTDQSSNATQANVRQAVFAVSSTRATTPDSFNIGDPTYTRGDAVDVASYQSWMTQDDFNKLKELGVKTVIVKITEGQTYVNPAASKQIAYAQNAGLNVAVYHYATFNNSSNGYAEGQHAAETMSSLGLGSNTLIFADMEDTKTYSVNAQANLNSFWSALTAAGFTNYGVYTYSNYLYRDAVIATVGREKTWIAQYPYSPVSGGSYETKWRDGGYGAWQFSSTAYIPGRENMGSLDLSTDFNGLLTYGTQVSGSDEDTSSNGSATSNKQQVYQDGHWYLIDTSTGNYVTGLQTIEGQNKTYYYAENGQMQYGQQKIDGHWYLFDQTTGEMQTGFQNLAAYGQDKSVYYDENGQMLYGQQKIAGNWYYFDTFDGAMKTGFVYIADQDKTVYYAENGQMQYGFQTINNEKYYFDTVTGAMKTGERKIDGNWYLFNDNGQMQYGFQTIQENGKDKTVYYGSNGQMLYGQQKIDGHWYYFDTFNGAMKTGFVYIADQNKTVYYGSNGQMFYGQQKIDGHWYYFDPVTGAMKTGFVYIADQNKTVYYGSNGQMLYGQQKIDGHWYYFDTFNGAMQTGFVYIADQDKTVYYSNNGQMLYGWQWINNHTYYFDTFNGSMTTGERYINGHWYLFDEQGIMQRGFQTVMENGKAKTVYYNQDGWMLYGWQTIDGKKYYFNTFNGALKN